MSIEFHKLWIDQCEATEEIRDHFGLNNALDYLIREKLFSFVHAAEQLLSSRPSYLRLRRRFGICSRQNKSATTSAVWRNENIWRRVNQIQSLMISPRNRTKTSGSPILSWALKSC